MASRTGIVMAVFMLFAALPAMADMDYHCLNECVRNGKTSTACMPRCTYTPQASFHKNEVNPGTNHNVFAAPQPIQGDTVLFHKDVKLKHESEDYACAQKCGKEGGEYELCKRNCTKLDPDTRQILPQNTSQSAVQSTRSIYKPQ